MNRLLLLNIACFLLFLTGTIALYIKIFIHNIDNLHAIYVWACPALLSLAGSIACTFLSLEKQRKFHALSQHNKTIP